MLRRPVRTFEMNLVKLPINIWLETAKPPTAPRHRLCLPAGAVFLAGDATCWPLSGANGKTPRLGGRWLRIRSPVDSLLRPFIDAAPPLLDGFPCTPVHHNLTP